MGYRLNRLDGPVFMAVQKPMLTEFGIHYRLESCGMYYGADTMIEGKKIYQIRYNINVTGFNSNLKKELRNCGLK